MPSSPTNERPDPMTTSRGRGSVVAAVLAFVALVPVGFFYAASGLLVPGPWLFLMWLLFAVLVVIAVVLVRRRTSWVLVVPVAGAGAWWAIVSAGEQWLGWTG